MAHDVFISYAKSDLGTAEAICRRLEENGVRCWIAPRDVLPGESYAGAIIKALHQSRLLVLVLSKDANNSPHVERELESALGKRLPLLPLRIADVELSESMQYYLRVQQWMDAFNGPLEQHLPRLTDAVRRWLGSGAAEPAKADPIQVSPVRALPATRIVTQAVGVSCATTGEQREGVVYRQAPLTIDEPPPAPLHSTAPWQEIRAQLREVDHVVAELTGLALSGRPIGQDRLAEKATALSRSILPRQGFVGMLPAGVQPQLDAFADPAEDIPWELLEEPYWSCANPSCAECGAPQSGAIPPRLCRACQQRLKATQGKIALLHHLTFLNRGKGFAGGGERFLLIDDPTGELRPPKGGDGTLFDELRGVIEHHGYKVETLAGRDAGADRVRAAIANPALAGIYYIGQSWTDPAESDEGLLLADGPLCARDIAEAAVHAPFVFLNLCVPPNAILPRFQRIGSRLAQSFAGANPGRVVISPGWPMAPLTAARTALEFLQHASVSKPLAEAMHHARSRSLERYEKGEPDLGWMSYRYIGDPNRRLPETRASSVTWNYGQSDERPLCRVFDDKALLNGDIFAFAIDDMLLRAAKRRNHQNRAHVSVTDLIAGVVRKGELTRHVCHRLGIDPDEIYDQLGTLDEPGARLEPAAEDAAGAEPAENDPQALIARWIVREEAQFDPLLVGLLITADENAQRRAGDPAGRMICERDVLLLLLGAEAWEGAADTGLPTKAEVMLALDDVDRAGELDANGCLTLAGLDPPGRRVIEVAHLLAQQRGASEITHRLMLAGFLHDPQGAVAQLCESPGAEPGRLYEAMIAITPDSPSRSFLLGMEVCSRVVLPMIHEARKSSGGKSALSERELFDAFWRLADASFREMLTEAPFHLNLDETAARPAAPGRPAGRSRRAREGRSEAPRHAPSIHVAELSDGVRAVLQAAAQLARAQGWSEIRSPHLFVALLGDGLGPTAEAFRDTGISIPALKALMLQIVPDRSRQASPSATMALSANTFKTVSQAIELANAAHRTQATELDLLEAFLADSDGIVAQVLEQAGLRPPPPRGPGSRGPDAIH